MVVPLLALTTAPLDLERLVLGVTSGHEGRCGAIATFLGVVRGENLGRQVLRLEYEAYEPLAVRTFACIRDEARERWPAAMLGIHHRTGEVPVGAASVAIVAASPHRADAFAVCRYAIERVKQIAPIWKREFFADGHLWIEGAVADPSDEDARDEAFRRACVSS